MKLLFILTLMLLGSISVQAQKILTNLTFISEEDSLKYEVSFFDDNCLIIAQNGLIIAYSYDSERSSRILDTENEINGERMITLAGHMTEVRTISTPDFIVLRWRSWRTSEWIQRTGYYKVVTER